MKTLIAAFMTILTVTVFAKEIIGNGNFVKDTNGWRLQPAHAKFDTQTKVSGAGALCIFSEKTGEYWALFNQKFELSPEKKYKLSFYIKGKDIRKSEKGVSGACIALKTGNRVLHYSSRGVWKYDTGTFDWTECSHILNTKYLQGKPCRIELYLLNCSGTVWFDHISIKEIQSDK